MFKTLFTLVVCIWHCSVCISFNSFHHNAYHRMSATTCAFPANDGESNFFDIPRASSVVYVSGVHKSINECDLISHFSVAGTVTKVELPVEPASSVRHGYALIYFSSSVFATKAIESLQNSMCKEKLLRLRLEESDIEGLRRHSRAKFAASRQVEKEGAKVDSAYYTGNSIVVTRGNVEYPISTGKYLMQLLQLFHSTKLPFMHQELFDILIRSPSGRSKTKDLTESMAVVQAVRRAGDLAGIDLRLQERVRVFAVADGIAPFSSAALGLFMPRSWRYWTVDPLLDFDTALLGRWRENNSLVKTTTQEFEVPPREVGESLTLVVACHSHAPLQELWDRVPPPKMAVVMPCCGKAWSSLRDPPIDVYDDYEVLSPKRKMYLYFDGGGTQADSSAYRNASVHH